MRNEALIEYGHRLLKAGFTVWVPRGPGWQHIVYLLGEEEGGRA